MKKLKQMIPVIVFFVVGAACGFFIGNYTAKMFKMAESIGEIVLILALFLFLMYLACFLQIVIHESGHLIFGILTGYRFSSFRVGSLMLLKTEGKLKLRRLSLAGTGGQCLLIPPEMEDGKVPYVLYNLGGSLLNLVFAVIFGILAWSCKNIGVLSVFSIMMTIIGVAFACVNGIPFRLGTIDNDGYNARSLGKTSEALRSFWIQMKINEQVTYGVRLKDMPDEWFEIPTDESMKNSMVSVMGVFACNRLMDEMKFEEADQTMERLLSMDTGIIGLYKNLMVSDLIYCKLISGTQVEEAQKLMSKQQRKFMKTMKTFPGILRTEYTYALLVEQNEEKANQIMNKFEKMAKSYPHQKEIEAERELMTHVQKNI